MVSGTPWPFGVHCKFSLEKGYEFNNLGSSGLLSAHSFKFKSWPCIIRVWNLQSILVAIGIWKGGTGMLFNKLVYLKKRTSKDFFWNIKVVLNLCIKMYCPSTNGSLSFPDYAVNHFIHKVIWSSWQSKLVQGASRLFQCIYNFIIKPMWVSRASM